MTALLNNNIDVKQAKQARQATAEDSCPLSGLGQALGAAPTASAASVVGSLLRRLGRWVRDAFRKLAKSIGIAFGCKHRAAVG